MALNIKKKNKVKRRIAQIIRNYLLRIFLVVFVLSIVAVVIFNIIYSGQKTLDLIEQYVTDVADKTDEDFNRGLEEFAKTFCSNIEDNMDALKEDKEGGVRWLQQVVEMNEKNIDEFNIIDSNGIDILSNFPEHIGYDMSSGEQSAEFMCLLNGVDIYIQDFQAKSTDKTKIMKYVGVALPNGQGFYQIGITEEKYKEWVGRTLAEEVRHRRIGLIGYIVILNRDLECIGSTGDTFNGRILHNTEMLPAEEGEYKRSVTKINGYECYLVSTIKEGYYIIGGFPVGEALKEVKVEVAIAVILILVLLVSVFLSLSVNLNYGVVKDIEDINRSLAEITGGNLDERVDVNNSVEFEELSEGINRTVDKLNQMIEEADKRLDKELETARVIQSTSLPNVFPPFPQRKDISLFAMMDTAKKVGGDFYDYYMLSDNRLAIIMADVSDKGIPAALFMMRAKTIIKALAVAGKEVDEVMMRANEELVKDNEAGMFVTVWIGFLELDTGLIKYVHAGHTCPMLIRDGSILMIKQKRNFIVGGRPGIRYLKQEFQLLKNDTLFLYTDGVTEAFDDNSEEYGNERLEMILYKTDAGHKAEDSDDYCKEVCLSVRKDVAAFSAGAPQSDDITMLCLRYLG